jgi:hypothetical protein
VTIGEKDFQKLLNGSQSTRSNRKIKLPYHKTFKYDDFLPKIDEHSISDGTLSEQQKNTQGFGNRKNSKHKKSKSKTKNEP